jgi:predicted DNA-binding antitoxin AbrB/MazE fold protein
MDEKLRGAEMNLTVQAVYENGVFRPVTPVSELTDGTSVVLTIQNPENPSTKGEKRTLSSKEMHEYIRSKNPNEEEIPEELWEEAERATQIAMSNVRDPEVMRQAADRMDRLGEQIYKREGLLDIAVPYLREARDEE